MAFEWGLENRVPGYPYFTSYFSPTRKQAGDNADCYYLHAEIDGTHTYRVAGKKGSARFINFTLQGEKAGALPQPWGDKPEASLLGSDLLAEWDGSFVLWISPEPHEGNWLRSTPNTHALRIRQFFDDWELEEPMRVRIERVGAEGAPTPPGPDEMIAAMEWAGQFLYDTIDYWPSRYVRDAAGGQLHTFASGIPASGQLDAHQASDALRGRAVNRSHWRLGDDEALIVEFAAPDWFWILSVENVFAQSGDYRWRKVSINSHSAVVDPDGKVRAVLAHRDPGYANWIDTGGYCEGALNMRNFLTRSLAEVSCRLVKHGELASEMPADAARLTPEERRAELARQSAAVARRLTR
jgi:hypothetical protein